MIVKIKETSIIRPMKETPKTHLWVSDMDLLVQRVYVPTVYFYKQEPARTNVNANFFDAQVLKEALAEVIVPFYPAAGTLGTDENGRTHIDCNAKGVLFVEAETTRVVDDFGDFTPCPEMQHLLPTIDSSLKESSKPLFAAQLTRFKCGSVSLGVMFHHVVVDGISAIHFINSWSDIARGKPITVPPFIDRTLLDTRVPPAHTFHHSEYDPHPTMKNPSTLEPTGAKILSITHNQLFSLKSKFNSNNPGTTYTTFEILATNVWYCMCKARALPDDQPTMMYIPTNGRSKLNPPLPQGFFGNAVFLTTVLSTAGEILSTPLDQTTVKIRRSLQKMDDGYMKSAIEYLKSQPDLTVLRKGPHKYQCPNLNMVSWTRMPMYDADFGWGKPVHMGRADIAKDGCAYVLPSPNNDGSLLLFVYLQANHIEAFEKFFYDLITMKSSSIKS